MTEPALPRWERRFLILAPPAMILLFGAMLLSSIGFRRQTTERVQRTHANIGLIRQVHMRLVDAETGQRGFIITFDSSYLEPQHTAARETHAALDSLRASLRGDTVQAVALAELQRLVSRRLQILELPIQRRADSFAAARDQLIAGRGKEAMDSVREQLGLLEDVERQRLATELTAQQRAGQAVLGVVLAGLLVILAVAVTTRRRFATYERELEQANAGLKELNARLQEQAVELELQTNELELQTADLLDARAELEASNEELRLQQRQLEDQALELEIANEDLQAAGTLAEERRAEAEAANQVKTQFLTSMSHELRTPLNAIAGYVDLLEYNVHGPLTDAQRNALHRIKLNGNHLLVLINDILDYAKIQAGRAELRNQDISLDALIAETADLVQPLLQSREITFQTVARPVSVHGDPDRIRQILLNLFTNAAKYSDPGGTITVSADTEGECVRLSVRDNGMGIPPELQADIFDPFVRLNRASGGSLGDGVGLGLSISRQLATAMRGDLTVESMPGAGSTFTLTLLRAQTTAPAGAPGPAGSTAVPVS